jgi:hippurate hydrolase
MKIIDSIVTQAAGIAALRREIHSHPELCFEEVRTADLVARKLAEWGIPIHRGLAKTGVVGVVKGRDGGASGRAIGLRADIDALPLQEHNTFAHASKIPGRMHACGHDGHTAMLLAAAQHFAKNRNFDGTVYLIFQPAEEGGGGARVMVEEGLFEKFPMEAVFGMHNWPGLPVGKFAASPGPVMAGRSDFRMTVRGKGSHAALPHTGIDPVTVACQVVQGFQTLMSREKKAADAAVLSVTMIHAGDATNIVPDSCEIQGTIRTYTYPVMDMLERRAREILEHTCAAFGAQGEAEFVRVYPPTVNHAKEAEFAARVLADFLGPENVLEQEPAMASEDFSFMLEAKPGCYIFIANGEGDHRVHDASGGPGAGPCALHNPSYDFNDELIPLGATYWVRLAEAWLAAK